MKSSFQQFFQRRLHRFGVDMIVIGVCFFLYYLGFFGGVAGPLNPSRIGDMLVDRGVTTDHVLIFFIGLAIAAVSWNWIYNLVSYFCGRRLTCIRSSGACCDAPVKRMKSVSKKTGATVSGYVCTRGHKHPEAHFHPLKKGTIAHTLSAVALIFGIIVWYIDYVQ